MSLLEAKNGPRLWAKILRQFPKGAVIAGGAVRDHFLGCAPKDIDVFLSSSDWPATGFPGFSPLDADRDNEYAAMSAIDVVQRGFIDGVQVDVIGLSARLEPAALVQTFDFGITRCWFDGRKVHDTPEAAADRAAKTVTQLLHDRPARAQQRFQRFNDRMGGGWRLVAPEMAAA